jgi:hypothetical protein
MKNKLKVVVLFVSALLVLNTAIAKADPTYAVLDENGNVTNIIICGEACAGGTFDGKRVVLQVAADPVTGENRGGIWQGPGTTTYDDTTQTFTMVEPPSVINNSAVDMSGDSTAILVTSIAGEKTTSFSYLDTVGDNLFTRNGFKYGFTNDSQASVFASDGIILESLSFESRKTEDEISNNLFNLKLDLLNSKVQTLVSLLGAWVKK